MEQGAAGLAIQWKSAHPAAMPWSESVEFLGIITPSSKQRNGTKIALPANDRDNLAINFFNFRRQMNIGPY